MISVIVPIYKVEKYLRQCIESLVAQTERDLEIILVNDGSPDNCPAICDEYSQKDSRIKVVHKQNGGLVSARKAGLEAAKGEYIGFVDGDDWVEPDMYEKMHSAVDKFNPDMVISEFNCDFDDHSETSSQCFSEKLYSKEQLNSEIYPIMLFNGTYYRFGVNPNCWSKLYRRELLEKNLPLVDNRIRMGEDAAFTYPCLLDAKSVFGIKTPMYHYRITNQSMSTAYDESLHDIILLAYERLKEKNNGSEYDISSQLDYYLLYMTNFLVRNESKSYNKKSKEERNKIINGIARNEDIKHAAQKVSPSVLPLHTKLLTAALKSGSAAAIKLYMLFLKIYLKG